MSWLDGLFGSKKQKEEPLDQLKIYTDQQFTNHVNLQISKITIAENVIESMFSETNFSLVLVTEITEKKNNVKLFRRVLAFEQILRQLEQKPLNVTYHYLINDFSIKKHIREERQIVADSPKIKDQNFEQAGRLQKKNKKGKYVDATGYLNAIYFGFLNVNKKKVKLFKLENLQLCVWDDDCEFSFKIITLNKIYFFRSHRESEFKYWLNHIERRLETTRYRFTLLTQEKQVLDCNKNRQVLIEDQVKRIQMFPNNLENFYEYVLGNCMCSTDLNLLKWALLVKRLQGDNQDKDDEIIKVLFHSWNQITQDYKNEQYRDRLQGQSEFIEREQPLRYLLEFCDFCAIINDSENKLRDDQQFFSQEVLNISAQVLQIIQKKYYTQYQSITTQKIVLNGPNNMIRRQFVETPNFQFFLN